MDSVCSKLDCRDIKPGGSCFEPDILENHASYAIDLNYRFNGVCPSNIGTITLQEPTLAEHHQEAFHELLFKVVLCGLTLHFEEQLL
ncbi:hypothetical protein LguiB_006434 [Lonicera macranthoides]